MIIGLLGEPRCGKNTMGRMLGEHGYTSVSFAEAMKDAVSAAFGIERRLMDEGDREAIHPHWGISIREMQQELGTGMRVIFGDNIWILRLDRQIDHSADVVITDVRFENEVEYVHSHGGVIVGLVRHVGKGEARLHKSDDLAREHLHDVSDYVRYNNGTMQDLQSIVMNLVETLAHRQRPS